MTDPIDVDLGGSSPGRPERRGGGGIESKWAWLAIGLGLGLAVSLLVTVSARRAAEDEVGSEATTTTSQPVIGISDVIPEFPDGLNILVSPGEGRALEVLTWPLTGEPVYRSVPLGDLDIAGTAHFDASGHFLAATTFVPGGLLLHAGRPNTFGVVAGGITGFAWHDTAAADLAWSEIVDDELRIWVSDDAGDGELAFSGLGVGETLVAFGDWGFAVTERSGAADGVATFRTYLLAPSGGVSVIDGRVIASHGSGLLLVEDGGSLSLVPADAPGDTTAIRIESIAGDVVVGGEFSPDGDRFAVTSFDGVTVFEVETQRVTNHSIRAGSDSMSWSSDGRYLLVSGFRGVSVLDTSSGAIDSILELETTRAVATTPIGGP